ncbi:MAG: hypothetical protein KUG76_03210 [Gammaproteobacteria bacterium]|nr:hypothetical protein [Gammaproteobacteria bacterium]
MARLIVLFALGFSAYWLYRQVIRKLEHKQNNSPSAQQKKMVKCCHCKVHFPEDQSYLHDDRIFCSQVHAHLFAKELDKANDAKDDDPPN